MFNVNIRTIPHDEQRYDTVGDWLTHHAAQQHHIQVSNCGNWKFEFLIALHELVEMALCQAKGVSTEQVDEFDLSFKGEGEPGDDPSAPYHFEHQFASLIEKTVAAKMGVNWSLYCTVIDLLGGEHGVRQEEKQTHEEEEREVNGTQG